MVPLIVPELGAAVTVTTLVAVASAQGEAETVYVMVEEPALCGLIAPVEASIVATPVVPLVHAPPESPSVVNVVEPVEQMLCVPESVPALGAGVTVQLPSSVHFGPFAPVHCYRIGCTIYLLLV